MGKDAIFGSSKTSELIRNKDWSQTALGPIGQWNQDLLVSVNTALAVPTPVQILWGESMLLLYNDAFISILKDKHPSALGMPAREVWGEVWPDVGAQLEAVFAQGQSYEYRDLPLDIDHNGKLQRGYFTFTYSPIRDVQGKVVGLLNISQDTTSSVAARIAEAARLRLEESLRAFSSATNDVLYQISADWSAMNRLSVESFLLDTAGAGRNWLDEYVHPEDHERVNTTVQQAIRSGSIVDLEHRVLRADGSAGWIAFRAIPVLDESGKVSHWFGAASDITARRQAEEAKFRLAAIVDSADDAIVGKDLNSTVISWNPAAAVLFGYSAHEMAGQSIRRIIPQELQGEEDMILQKIRAGERVEHFETTRVRKDGTRIEVSVTVSPVRDDAGRIIGASKIARDVSEKAKMHRMLVQSEKIAATGRMAATVAHELNNPLEAVLNLVYLARLSCPGNDEAIGYLDGAEQELQRAAHITKQTLGYYRDTSKPTEFSVSFALDELLKVYQPRLRNAGIVVQRNYNESAKLLANRGEILQVFSNIIANAIDAMRHGGTLEVSVLECNRRGQRGILIRIADTGPGIAADIVDKVFEPFFTTKGDLGNGIGLWVSREAVRKHGGEIEIASAATGDVTGTTVSIFIPQWVSA